MAGNEFADSKNVAKYWKNGKGVAITDGTRAAYTSAIAVAGNDVYVAGYEYKLNNFYVARYWKNGVAAVLGTGLTASQATSIALTYN